MNKLNIMRLTKTAILPLRATDGSAGFDLFADIPDAVTILPRHTIKIGTGICLEITDNNIVGLVYSRSGLSTKFGITLANCVGVIDSDYRGEVIIALHNSSEFAYEIQPAERVAQLVLTPIITPKIVEVTSVENTDRGSNGFGSTGKTN